MDVSGPRSKSVSSTLDLHHHRMVGRLKNIMDTLRHRACPADTVADEIGFLVLEVEAYRAFIHRHANVLQQTFPTMGRDELQDNADSLYFDVLKLHDRIQDGDVKDSQTAAHIARVGGRLLDRAQRSHTSKHRRRADQVAFIRAQLHGVGGRLLGSA
ncbi:hypothetical protein [Rhodospira trueperi]|uniref:Hemerythrin HHE cation binding domain-containing protein n=1 Tax=Rhodospira trueperi TaxID=69960 RepID=A0A1G7ED78_9PROT|nr:hypothetical protein [Rhodospira trueperi]SDE61406.1 hypothetical protein SAMN05421720_10914 [Rhodospira trueperi]